MKQPQPPRSLTSIIHRHQMHLYFSLLHKLLYDFYYCLQLHKRKALVVVHWCIYFMTCFQGFCILVRTYKHCMRKDDQFWSSIITFIYIHVYTLSHPENDRDITERAQGYTLQGASFMRQSRCSFLNA